MHWNLFKHTRRRIPARNRRNRATYHPILEALECRLAPSCNPSTWLNDRSLLKEESGPTVYVIYGGAKFGIPSQDEFDALHFHWSEVCTVPDGRLARVPNVPQDGTVLKERSNDAVYTMSSGNKFWIPTPSAFDAMRYNWPGVLGVVPNGGLAAFPTVREDSLAQTPPSLVFPPEANNQYPLFTHNATRIISLFNPAFHYDLPIPAEISLVELRGWLRKVDSDCNSGDPDWHYQLEVDSEWTDSQGIDLNQILKVGNLLEGQGILDNPYGSLRTAVGVPTIKLELNGWRNHGHGHADILIPPDWTVHDRTSVEGQYCSGSNDAYWPFDPLQPEGPNRPMLPEGNTGPGWWMDPLDGRNPAPYVRVVGSLLTDAPHTDHGHNPILALWSGGREDGDPANPARWTEIHSPDKIERMFDSQNGTIPHYPKYTLKEAAVIARSGMWTETLDADISPPGPPGAACAGQHAAVQELVGPETNLWSIVEGNPRLDGAQITVYQDHVHVHVAVRSNILVPGKFKALYRVYWEPGRPEALVVSPETVPGGTAGSAYSQTLSACGGAGGPFHYRVTAGTLPTGLILSDDGRLSGLPTARGSFPFTVTATGAAGFTGHRDYQVAIDPGPAARFRLDSPSSVQAGAPFSVTVAALDAYGNTATGYHGMVHLATMDGRATLPADYPFNPAERGTHTFAPPDNGVVLRTSDRTWILSVTDRTDQSVTGSRAVTVLPLAATSLALVAPPIFEAGTPDGITVTALDQFRIRATNYRGTVHFTSTDERATLPPDYTFTGPDGGTHPFNVVLRTAGARTITVTDTADGRLTDSSLVVVNPGQISTFRFEDIPPSLTAGVASNLSLFAVDSYGNTVTGFGGTVHFTSSDQSARLPPDYWFQVYDHGVFRCYSCVTLFTAGRQTLTATQIGPGGISSIIYLTVVAGPLVTLAISGLPPEISAWTPTIITVTPQDQFGNPVATYRGTVHFTSTDTTALLPEDYAFTEADHGIHSFSGITLWTAGNQALTVTDLVPGGLTGSATTQVDPGPVSTLTIDAPTSISAGTPFDITVSARDLFGNLVTAYTGTITFTSSDDDALLPQTYTFTPDDSGAHTFTGVTLFVPGDQYLWVTDPDNALFGSATITVTLDHGGDAPSRRPPGEPMDTQSFRSGEAVLVLSNRVWSETGGSLAGRAAPLASEPGAARSALRRRNLGTASVDRLFAADRGYGRSAVLLRPRADVPDDFWQDLTYSRFQFRPLVPEEAISH